MRCNNCIALLFPTYNHLICTSKPASSFPSPLASFFLSPFSNEANDRERVGVDTFAEVGNTPRLDYFPLRANLDEPKPSSSFPPPPSPSVTKQFSSGETASAHSKRRRRRACGACARVPSLTCRCTCDAITSASALLAGNSGETLVEHRG